MEGIDSNEAVDELKNAMSGNGEGAGGNPPPGGEGAGGNPPAAKTEGAGAAPGANGNGAAAGGAAPAKTESPAGNGAGGNPPADPPPPAYKEEEVVKQNFDGKYASFAEIKAEIGRIQKLETDLQEAIKNPKFDSPRAKMLYEAARKMESVQDLSVYKQYLHVADLQLDELSDQQLRFEAFKLKPENQGFPESRLEGVFREEELEKYGDPDNKDTPQTDGQKFRAEIATTQARGELGKRKSEWEAAKPAEGPSNEDIAAQRLALKSQVEQTLSGFKETVFKLTTIGENGEKIDSEVKFAIDDNLRKDVIAATINPTEAWEKVMQSEGIVDESGKIVNMQKFGNLMNEFLNRKAIQNEIAKQSFNNGIAYKVKNARNPGSLEAPPGGPPGGGSPEPKNDAEGMGKALYETIHGK